MGSCLNFPYGSYRQRYLFINNFGGHGTTTTQVSVGTLGWWMFGWALAYGSQVGSFIGTDGFFGLGFYTKDASGNIVPVECDGGNCQSTMLSWFFQWASWMFSGDLCLHLVSCSWYDNYTITIANPKQ